MQRSTLKFYKDIRNIVEKLRATPRYTIVDDSKNGIWDSLCYLERILGENSTESPLSGILPFPRIMGLKDELTKFISELDEAMDASGEGNQITLEGGQRHRKLQHIMRRFEDLLVDEVESRAIFVVHERESLLRYLSPREFLVGGRTEEELFGRLPRMAQAHFSDAGKCLAYGMSGASIGLALQAMETTLRYFCLRHGCVDQIGSWKKMLDWLNGKKQDYFPGDQNDFARLEKLGVHYRNAVSHGRAYSDFRQNEASIAEAERVFDACRDSALMFARARRPQLRLQIFLSNKLDFDTVMATYLYWWNPELPPVTVKNFTFEHPIAGEIMDSAFDEPLKREPGFSLTRKTINHMQIQPSYAATLEYLLTSVDSNPEAPYANNPGRHDSALIELYGELWVKYEGNPSQLLQNAWGMLDRFIRLDLSPDDPQLIEAMR